MLIKLKTYIEMKKFFTMALAITAAAAMAGCKSQKTLSEAATVADPVEEVQEVAPIQYHQPAQSQPAPKQKPELKAGDRAEKVSTVNAAEASLLKDYNVVVGSFGSPVNAEAYKVTMQQRGYTAFLVKNEAGMYRVVAGSYDTREQAEPVRDRIRAAYPSEQGTCADAWLLIPKR